MKSFIFSEELPDKSYLRGFGQSLFNREDFRLSQITSGWKSFYALQPGEKKILASIHFHIDGQVAKSPYAAPFGSFDIAPGTSTQIIFDFIAEISNRVKSVAKTIVIKMPPLAMDSVQGSLATVQLLNHGFAIKEAETGAVIKVEKNLLEEKTDAWEIRKLRQGRQAGLTFKSLENSELSRVYDLIAAAREKKSYPLSMTGPELAKTANRFPKDYPLFGVFANDEMVASAVCIRVRDNALYYFYGDHRDSHDHLSPVVTLINGIYEYCQYEGISYLDLGTSAVNGKPNTGLLEFKMRMGAEPTPKFTFEKVVS